GRRGAGGRLGTRGKPERGAAVVAVASDRIAAAAVGPRHATVFLGGERRDLGAPPGPPVAASFSLDGRRLAVASADEITLYDVARGGTRRLPAAEVRPVAFSPPPALLPPAPPHRVLLLPAHPLTP